MAALLTAAPQGFANLSTWVFARLNYQSPRKHLLLAETDWSDDDVEVNRNMFSLLPPEIILLILDELGQSDKSKLARTCSSLHGLTLLRRYEYIELKLPEDPPAHRDVKSSRCNLGLFLRTLLTCPSLATNIKTIELDFDIGMRGRGYGRLPPPVWLTSLNLSELQLAEEAIIKVCSFDIWKGGRRLRWNSDPNPFNAYHQHLWSRPGYLERKIWIWDDEETVKDVPLWTTFEPRTSIDPWVLQEEWINLLHDGLNQGVRGHGNARADAVVALILVLCPNLRHIKRKEGREPSTCGRTYRMGGDDNLVARVLRGALNSQRIALEMCGKTAEGRWNTRKRPEEFQEGILVDLRCIEDRGSYKEGYYEAAYGWGTPEPEFEDIFKPQILFAARIEYDREPTVDEIVRYQDALEAERKAFGTKAESYQEIIRLKSASFEERQRTFMGRYAQARLERQRIREAREEEATLGQNLST